MKTNKSLKILTLTPLVLALTACGPKSESGDSSTAADLSGTGGSPFLLTEVPAEVPGLVDALAKAAPGEPLVFAARVGGTVDPLTPDFAAFVVADERLVFCDEMSEKGHCPTPWDACCEDPEKIATSRAFVQFQDETGATLEESLANAIGLAPNDTVVVQGILSELSTERNPIIIAKGLAINPEGRI